MARQKFMRPSPCSELFLWLIASYYLSSWASAITFDGLLTRYGASTDFMRRKSDPLKRFGSASLFNGDPLLGQNSEESAMADAVNQISIGAPENNTTEKIPHAKAVISDEPISCSYSTSDALDQRLRLRASFNPLLMSDTLDAAQASIKALLDTHGYNSSSFSRRTDDGKQDDESAANTKSENQANDPDYFARANSLATREMMKNRQLNLREACSLGGRITSLLNSTSALQTRRRRSAAAIPPKRRHRAALGTQKQQFCLDRGQPNEDGLLRLCKICAVVTELPADYYPRYINEIVCDSSDDGCLYAGPLPHGQCVPKTLQLTVLKRLVNHQCLEDWQPVKLEARVSCECFVYQSSFLRPFV